MYQLSYRARSPGGKLTGQQEGFGKDCADATAWVQAAWGPKHDLIRERIASSGATAFGLPRYAAPSRDTLPLLGRISPEMIRQCRLADPDSPTRPTISCL
jgi:hypothetical protein